jgi:hypothetical protein
MAPRVLPVNVQQAASWTEAQWQRASGVQRIAALKVLKRDYPGWKAVSWRQHSAAHSGVLRERYDFLLAKVR